MNRSICHHDGFTARDRAFTLLETLLAVTILSVLMSLVAVLWNQARSWTEDSTKEQSSLHITRLINTMRTQWNDRRSIDANQSILDAAGFSPDEVRFITATPILFPDWPLVRAYYRIEYEPFRGTLAEPRFRLVYTETRLPGGHPDPLGSVDASGQAMSKSVVLLEDCSILQWERFGPERATQSRRTAREGRSVRSNSEVALDDDDLQQPWEWYIFETEFEDRISAVRLVGESGKERFACILVAAPLR